MVEFMEEAHANVVRSDVCWSGILGSRNSPEDGIHLQTLTLPVFILAYMIMSVSSFESSDAACVLPSLPLRQMGTMVQVCRWRFVGSSKTTFSHVNR